MSERKQKVACLYHNDADGFGSAFAIWAALNKTHELLFIPVQYSQDPPYEKLREFAPNQTYIVDFSYKPEIYEEFKNEFPATLVIDHHASSAWLKDDEHQLMLVDGLELGAIHDESKSGCMLTWEHFHPDASPPDILYYVQDRDLWKFELEHSKEVNAFIATMPDDFNEWYDFYTPEAYTAGRAILAFQKNQINRRLENVVMVAFDESELQGIRPKVFGRKNCLSLLPNVPFVNASENQSELGEAMCLAYPDAPFSVSYCDRSDGSRSYSLRSRSGYNVGEVAKAFGGGGHPAAAGFTLAAPEII